MPLAAAPSLVHCIWAASVLAGQPAAGAPDDPGGQAPPAAAVDPWSTSAAASSVPAGVVPASPGASGEVVAVSPAAPPAPGPASPPPHAAAPQQADSERPEPARHVRAETAAAPPPSPVDERERSGVTISAALGVGSCAQPACAVALPAAIGRFGIGYRFPSLEIGIDTSIAGSRFISPRDFAATSARQTFWDLTFGVRWYPIRHHRFEPYVGLALGVFRFRWALQNSYSEVESVMKRALLRASVGLDIRLGRRFAVGPRYDHGWPFMGKECITDYPCESLPEAWEEPGDDKTTRAQVRRALPRPWSFTLVARVIF